MSKSIDQRPLAKGRGAITNDSSNRFNLPSREMDGDWLDDCKLIDDPVKFRTEITSEFPRSIINFNSSPDLPFDRSVNAYRGCEHGCIYCYARPTHAYYDLSPGQDFETKLFTKPNAAELLLQTFAKPSYQPAPLAIGTNTDPYQPIERQFRITRAILEVMLQTRHPVGITTKSDKLMDDLDLLSELAKLQLTAVAISVTTLNPATARLLEPRAPSPSKRLAAVERLRIAGIPVHVNIAPVVPAITDHELENIVKISAEKGAQSVSFIPVRLPHEVAPLFEEWLEAHFPDRKDKVLNIIASMRSGKRNDPNFYSRMRGEGPWADLIRTRLKIAASKHGLNKGRFELRTDLFKRPLVKGSQMELF
ncbi:MAG: PA0069 family radical SAM protein [Parasphingorhabdus sp.]